MKKKKNYYYGTITDENFFFQTYGKLLNIRNEIQNNIIYSMRDL